VIIFTADFDDDGDVDGTDLVQWQNALRRCRQMSLQERNGKECNID
jgi:hypothetical protein